MMQPSRPLCVALCVESLSDVLRGCCSIQVHYSKNMPDIETLMQEWPSELEDTLKHLQLPDGALHASIVRPSSVGLRWC
jgi:intraflagellar transport protein 46